jgi:uncharacterized phiE125 gp8 family phage protein
MTPAQAREHIRGAETSDDTYLTGLIAAVTTDAEAYTHRGFITQTWRYYCDYFSEEVIELPIGRIQSITSVKYYNASGTLTTMSGSLYQADIISEPGRISLAAGGGSVWPTTQLGRNNAVEIEFVVGYGPNATDVPDGIIQACKLQLGSLFDNRSDEVLGLSSTKLTRSCEMLLFPFRIFRFP